MPANDKSDWQIEKNKQKITTTKHGHRCSCLASGKVRFLGHKFAFNDFPFFVIKIFLFSIR